MDLIYRMEFDLFVAEVLKRSGYSPRESTDIWPVKATTDGVAEGLRLGLESEAAALRAMQQLLGRKLRNKSVSSVRANKLLTHAKSLADERGVILPVEHIAEAAEDDAPAGNQSVA